MRPTHISDSVGIGLLVRRRVGVCSIGATSGMVSDSIDRVSSIVVATPVLHVIKFIARTARRPAKA